MTRCHFPTCLWFQTAHIKGMLSEKFLHPDGEVRSIPGIVARVHQMFCNALRTGRMWFATVHKKTSLLISREVVRIKLLISKDSSLESYTLEK
jgi:hypothetical protein